MSITSPVRLAALTVLMACLSWAVAHAEALQSAVTMDDVDVEACAVFGDGEVRPASAAALAVTLGLDGDEDASPWSAGRPKDRPDRLDNRRQVTFRYRLAFKRPVRIGSMIGPRGRYHYLKPNAKYPGEPDQPEHWAELDVRPRQSGLATITLPKGFQTRALLYTHTYTVSHYGFKPSVLSEWRLLEARLHNLMPDTLAWASQSALNHPVSVLSSGSGLWTNAVEDRTGVVRRAPLSETHPETLVLFWPRKQTVCGLYLRDNFADFQLYEYVGPDTVMPPAATRLEWRKLSFRQNVDGGRRNQRWVWFDPVETKGIRIRITRSDERHPRQATVSAIQIFTDLGDREVPALTAGLDPRPPFRVPFKLDEESYVTMVLEDANGRRVRNLVARVLQEAGPNEVPWDLKDEDGQYVRPGKYNWRAITHPPLDYIYQMTALPNVQVNNPGSVPWRTGMGGAGGWLADHGPPISATCRGDRMFFGGVAPENGTGFIATDLDGRKLWGIHSFASFSGAHEMAATGNYVFAAAPPIAMSKSGGGEPDRIWRVNIEERNFIPFLIRPQTNERRGGVRGLAAHGDRLYVSVNSHMEWLTNAAAAKDVDIEHCVPLYPKAREPKWRDDRVADPRADFVRLFRLRSTPPGWPGKGALISLRTERSDALVQHIVLAFKRPVPVGTIVYPVPQHGLHVKLSVLKQNGQYPPNPNDPSQWVAFKDSGDRSWDAVPAPEQALTRALRISLSRAKITPLTESMQWERAKARKDDMFALDDPDPVTSPAGPHWAGMIEGMKILRRRYQNLADSAKVRVNSGVVTRQGTWYAQPEKPLSRRNPAIFLMQWDEPQQVRGLAVQEIEAKISEIDVYTGPDTGTVPIEGDQHWRQVATYKQELRGCQARGILYYDAESHYMDGYVDFGRQINTRAIRIRMVEQYTTLPKYRKGYYRDPGKVNPDIRRYDIDRERPFYRIYGVAPLQYVGGEVPVDLLAGERIEVYDVEAKAKAVMGGRHNRQVLSKVPRPEREVHVPAPSKMAIHRQSGRMYALSEDRVVRVDFDGGKHMPIVTDLEKPTALAVDAEERLYVYDDAEPRRNVRVYSSEGRLLRTIGTPGGHKAGPWDPTAMWHVKDIEVDTAGHLWVVEFSKKPKRISRWTLDGKFERQFLGHTAYGGGGALDAWDRRRVFYGPLEFEIDWQKGTTRLKGLTWLGDTPAGEMPLRLNGRDYLVTRGGRSASGLAQFHVVYLYDPAGCKRMAALGSGTGFTPLADPDLMDQLDIEDVNKVSFTWADANGDGDLQAAEVRVWPRNFSAMTSLNRDLSCVAVAGRYHAETNGWQFEVKKFLPTGAPVFEQTRKLNLPAGLAYRWGNGTYFVMGPSKRDADYALDRTIRADGSTVWEYRTLLGPGVQRWYVPPWEPHHVMMEFMRVGHETPGKGDLGEFLVTNSNEGTWHIWTPDGMLAGRIFESFRDYRSRRWTMDRAEGGMSLNGVSLGEEHFNPNHFVKLADEDKYYAVAGHNHMSLVEVRGLDKFKRSAGTVVVKPEDFRRTLAWERERAERALAARAPMIDCLRPAMVPVINGKVSDMEWPGEAKTIQQVTTYGREVVNLAAFRMARDEQKLYLCWQTWDLGPLKNTGEDWRRLFKTGAAVELKMSTDPAADSERKGPVAGDLRLLITVVDDKPVAVLYEPVAAGAHGEGWSTTTPAGGTTSFDRVRKLQDVQIAWTETASGYVVEAAVPMKTLGLNIEKRLRLKLDWGILSSGPEGTEVARRLYWANKTASVTSDEPTEARLHPHMWGTVRFIDAEVAREKGRPSVQDVMKGGGEKLDDEFLDRLQE